MKKLLVPLLAVVALAAVGLLVARSLGSTGAPREVARVAPAAGAPAPAASGAEAAEPAGSPASLAERSPIASEGDGRFGAWPRGAPRRIEGRVPALAGVPRDPTLRVLALRRAVSAERIYGTDGILDALRAGAEAEHPDLVSTAAVGADGRFRVALPADATEAWLAIDGRYLFSKSCERVGVPTDAQPVELAPTVGARILGRVLLPEGASAALLDEVRVVVGPDSSQFGMLEGAGRWLFERASAVDGEGRFELRAIDVTRPYELTAECASLANQVQGSLGLEAGRDTEVEVQLQRGATVRGRVLDAAGRGVADAEVHAVATMVWGFPVKSIAEGRSDAEGRYELAGVPAGTARLLAQKEGLLEGSPRPLAVADGEVHEGFDLRMEEGNSISGFVRHTDGRPAAGVRVGVRFDPNAMVGATAMNAARGADGSAETGAQGAFRVGGLGKGPFLVAAQTGDDGAAALRAEQAGVRPNTEGLTLVLDEPPYVRGQVVDASGAPVPEFTLLANNQGAVFWVPGESRRESFSDENGEFRLGGLREGVWNIEVVARRFGVAPAVELTLPRADPDQPLVFVLEPSLVAEGVVLDPLGEPLAGASVGILVDPDKAFAQLTGRLETPEAYTDEEGAFRLPGLSRGAPSLVAKHADFAPSEPVQLEVERGGTISGVVLQVRRGGLLTGEVFDKEGEPMAGGQVFVQDTSNWETLIQRTDPDGTFRVERLRPGSWQVTAMTGSLDPGVSPEGSDGDVSDFFENMRFTVADVKDGEETHVVLGAPPENPVSVQGTVTHAGEPVEGAMISFFPEGAAGFDAMKLTQLGEGGSYEIQLETSGAYLVQVQSFAGSGLQQNNVEFSETVPEGEAHTLDLELPLGAITGRVLGPDRDPMRGARVTLTTDGGIRYGTFVGGQYAETSTDDDGVYRFEYVRPGVYSVAAGGSMFGGAFGQHSSVGRVVHHDVRLAEREELDGLDFRLELAGEIAGVVRDAAGRPVSGASIFVRDDQGSLLERFSMITTGADGRFAYSGVSPGAYTVTARTREAASETGAPANVRSGETAEVTVTLTPATVLVIRVIDRTGDDVDARVSVLDPQGREVNGMIAYSDLVSGLGAGFSTSEQRVGPLPPGAYTVVAMADDGRTSRKPVQLDGQPERKLKVRLRSKD